MQRPRFAIPFLILLFTLCLKACSGAGGLSGFDSTSGVGTLAVNLIDATTDAYNAVYVTVSEVQVCTGSDDEGNSEWLTVAQPNGTYNLLELVNGEHEQLGIASLETGHYNQLRLIIGSVPDTTENILIEEHPFANYVIDSKNMYHELKIPSGFQTGIKLVGGFDILSNETTDLTLDFDASRSVVNAGNSGNWFLNPTIKVLGATAVTITGRVDDAVGDTPIEGALVSVQSFDPEALEPAEATTVKTATVTDKNGEYTIVTDAGSYCIVVVHNGYSPAAVPLETEPGCVYGDQNFDLDCAPLGGLAGTAVIEDGTDEAQVYISVRMDMQLDGGDGIQPEIASATVANGGEFMLDLPEGAYRVVASADGKASREWDVAITVGDTVLLDVSL